MNELSGRYVYVGDTGDVVSSSTLSVVATLPALQNTRQLGEVDWTHGTVSGTSTRFGVGRVTSASSPGATPTPHPQPTAGTTQTVAATATRPPVPAGQVSPMTAPPSTHQPSSGTPPPPTGATTLRGTAPPGASATTIGPGTTIAIVGGTGFLALTGAVAGWMFYRRRKAA